MELARAHVAGREVSPSEGGVDVYPPPRLGMAGPQAATGDLDRQPPAAAGDILATVEAFPAARGGLDLVVRRGEIVLLEGPNGAGKSSLLRALAGLTGGLTPRGATLGPERDHPSEIPAATLARNVRAAWQSPRDTLVGLTVAGEFRLRGHAPAAARVMRDGRQRSRSHAGAWQERTVATLSSGEARRLSLEVVAASDAPLLLLDEPAEGLDAPAKQDLVGLVRAAALAGAVVAADHTGILAAIATRRVDLSPPGGAGGRDPAPSGRGNEARGRAGPDGSARPARLVSPPQTLRRGTARIAVPSLSLAAGFHVLVGPNGGGKSTLLLGLAGLLDASASIDDGLPMPGVNVRLLLPNVRDLFTAGTVADELAGSPTGSDPDPAVHWDAFVPPPLLARHPLTLSAGEAQRVALAKTFGRRAPAYLLDEPEANLDASGRVALLAAIATCVGNGACVLAATHDPGLIALAASVAEVGG